MSVLMLLVLVVALKGIVPWPANPETASPAEEVTGVIFMGIGIALFLWVSGVARDEYRDALARRYPRPIIPPDLVKNTQQARRALEQAEGQAQQALEQARRALEQTVMQAQEALEQGANVADELQDELEVKQRALDATQRQLSDTQEDVTVATSMRDEWYTRLARPLEGLLQRTGRRSFWSGFAANVIVGFVFYVLGVLTPVLVDADSLRALLQHWLRLG